MSNLSKVYKAKKLVCLCDKAKGESIFFRMKVILKALDFIASEEAIKIKKQTVALAVIMKDRASRCNG